jgi:predicted flap endonuclease-1-like 5' DNA nuclease
MHLLNSLMFVTCGMWPLLWLLLGALMWLLGWLFGRSKVGKLRTELEAVENKNKFLLGENDRLQKEFKVVKSDYDKTNKKLIATENSLDENNSKLNSALSKYRMIESEKNNLVSEKNSLLSEKENLLSEKENWDAERKQLKENSLEAADANISNKAIADLQDKLAETERALAACEASKIKEDKVSFVAPPPPPSSGSEINQLVSDSDTIKPSEEPESGMGKYFKNSNLQIIEGVGPKIESILKDAGYHTWQDLANASDMDLQKVLDDAGPRYRMHNPTLWSNQARYAADGDWDSLIKYQKDTDGDVEEPNSKAEKLYFKAMGFSAAKPDDLKVVEGIGPKIESLLKDAGIKNWLALASSEVSRLQDILTSAGDRYRLADPGTWPKQAELAASGKWTELKEYQDFLSGGKA